ncbi:VOC family protein [Pseudonocardia kongjuensis]|uniref:VOC family protein n=1 Tax=Pseudonocardia kongjuensis TaxID=102227 RepID=A0ABN1XTX2_9PSEU
MASVGVRYLVSDVAAAAAFYTTWLGFTVEFDAAPGFAVVTRGELRLMLNAVGGPGGAQPMPYGQVPEPGRWNRIQLEVADLEAEVTRLGAGGLRFRNDIVVGRGGSQVLLEDPSGNPRRAVPARLSRSHHRRR